ncbi:hypothetical protein [Metabacillus fastidiosus]|uniref:Uncharacterized protein n=1 Tax=Metabacillus fastidiosus TaxID=1458 RepID=A0ABU6NRX2_9BACI|nr:hypothetical protein [Metabacillus fastidiosus]
MIRTKLFTGTSQSRFKPGQFVECDIEINEFIEDNNIEVVDIKFASASNDGAMWHTALLIYKERIS